MEIKKVRTKNYQTKEYQTKEYTAKKKKTILDCTGSRAAISSNLLPFCLSSIFRDFGKIPQKSQIADSSCQKNPLGKKVNEKKKKKNSEKGLSSTMHVLFPARKLIQRKKKKKWCMYRIHVWKTPIFLSSLVPCVCYFYKGSCELV